MTGSSSISGLASGLDTATIISQLMQLEAMPQNRLRVQQASEKSVLAALQSLNTDTSLLGGKAEALAKTATWQTLMATSTNTDVSATVGTGAAAGTFTITVDRLASRTQLGFANAAALTDVVTNGSAVRITAHDGTVHDVTTGGGTLKEVVDAINASTTTTGVTAVAVSAGNGTYRLLAQSATTGATTDFTLTNADGTAILGGATLSAGTDAQVSLGTGITVTSSTNTFTDLVPGVTVKLADNATLAKSATVTVAQDASGVKSSIKALVSQLNDLLGSFDKYTASGGGTAGAAGVLSGDATARGVRSALLNTVFGAANTSMASVGIETDKYGKIVFKEDVFDKAYAADPAAVAAQFTTGATTATDGWAARLQAVTKAASDSTVGSLTTAITGQSKTIDRLGESIDAWDRRLELRRTTLTRQFTALETALSNLQSQGNWLAGQIASLPNYSSSS